MPNLLDTYIKYRICKHILSETFLNKPQIVFLHTVIWFQVLLYNSYNLTSLICWNTWFVGNFIFK